MIRFLKSLWSLPDTLTKQQRAVHVLETHYLQLAQALHDLKTERTEPSLALIRHQLGSIDLADVPGQPVGDARKAAASRASSFYELDLLPAIKRFIRAQEEFATSEAQNWDQVTFARGTVNGLGLIRDYFEGLAAEHRAEQVKDTEPFDPHSPIATV